jgi:hypothetical protein
MVMMRQRAGLSRAPRRRLRRMTAQPVTTESHVRSLQRSRRSAGLRTCAETRPRLTLCGFSPGASSKMKDHTETGNSESAMPGVVSSLGRSS